MKRVLLGRISHEVASFVPGRTGLDVFQLHGLLEGDEVLRQNTGNRSTIAGIVDVAQEAGVELIPTIAAYGQAGPPVADEAYARFKERILAGARQHRGELAGVILPLHGAMVTESLEDPEADLIRAVREVVGPEVPIVVSLDLHGHITDATVAHCDGLTALQTHPHVDMYENGVRGMRLLVRAMAGEVRPVVAHRKLRMMSSAETHNTTTGPMSEVMRRALEIEKEPGVLAVAIFPTQPWMDVQDLGWSIVVTADGDRALAQAKADEIGMMCWERRERFLVHKTPIGEAVERSLAGEGKPYVLSDSSDSVTGGGNGDGNFLLKTLLEMGYADTAIITLTDPEAVAACFAAGVGATLTLPVGGKLTPTFYSPVTVTGTVNTLWNGQYTAFLTPMPVDIGRSAVLQAGGIRLLLSEHKAGTIDAQAYRGAGLEPRDFKIVQVKSPGGFRTIYGPFAAGIFELEATGPCDADLPRLPFTRISRPLWPWDRDLDRPW